MYSPHIIQDVKGISFIPFLSHKGHHGNRFYLVE